MHKIGYLKFVMNILFKICIFILMIDKKVKCVIKSEIATKLTSWTVYYVLAI